MEGCDEAADEAQADNSEDLCKAQQNKLILLSKRLYQLVAFSRLRPRIRFTHILDGLQFLPVGSHHIVLFYHVKRFHDWIT